MTPTSVDPSEMEQNGYRVVLAAEWDHLTEIAEWARDADHHAGCYPGYSTAYDVQYPCKCGRRELFGDRIDDAPTFAKVYPLGPPRNTSSSRWEEGTDDE